MTELTYSWYLMEDANRDYETASTPCGRLNLYVYPDEAYEKFLWEIQDKHNESINGSWEFENGEFDMMESAKVECEALTKDYLVQLDDMEKIKKEQDERNAEFAAARAKVDQERRAAGMQLESDKKEQLKLL